MRVFIPATAADLIDPEGLQPRPAHAVTSALSVALPEEDEEALAFVATLAAADDAVTLLRDRRDLPPRRVVLVAESTGVEVPRRSRPWAPDDDELPSRVLLTEPVRWRDVVAIHADSAGAEADVLAAIEDPAALDDAAEHDLLWFDVTERDRLVAELGLA